MRYLRLGDNIAVFLLLFGTSVLEGLRSHDWPASLLWAALGLVFLRADVLSRRP